MSGSQILRTARRLLMLRVMHGILCCQCLLVGGGLAGTGLDSPKNSGSGPLGRNPGTESTAVATGNTPVLQFVPNRGQFAPDIRFGGIRGEVAVALGDNFLRLASVPDTTNGKQFRAEIRWIGTQDEPEITGLDPASATHSFFLGNDPTRWKSDLPAFEGIRVEDLYPGIDLLVYQHGDLLEFDYLVHPGADPQHIQWKIAGDATPQLDLAGELVMEFGPATFRMRRPVAYQQEGGQLREVASSFESRDAGEALGDAWNSRHWGIALGEFDRTRMLVIDPILSYSSYYGGTQFDSANALAVDTAGNSYIVGETWSVGLLLLYDVQNFRKAGKDVFVLRMNPALNAVTAATYFGGNGDDIATSSVVAGGDLVIGGETTSTDLPGTAGRYQPASGGGKDGFVTRLRLASGPSVVGTTYVGGFGSDRVNAIVHDVEGNLYVAGFTTSSNFPLSTPSFGELFQGGTNDAFVVKMSPDLSHVYWSGIYGGLGSDNAEAIALGAEGSVWITGTTSSAGLPMVNPAQDVLLGAFDCFVAGIAGDGQSLLLSTYMGGSSSENCYAIQTDSAGNPVVAGSSASANFPTTDGVYQSSRAGSYDNILFKINALSGFVSFATFLGGSQTEAPNALFLNSTGNWCMAGYTLSSNFPLADPVQPDHGGSMDGFLSCLNADATSLVFSTYLGGSEEDRIQDAALQTGSLALLTGLTQSLNFPVTNGALQPTSRGNGDAFLTAINLGGGNVPPVNISVSPSNGNTASALLTYTVEDGNGWRDLRHVYTLIHNVVSAAGGCYVRYDIETNILQLLNDTGTSWVGTAKPGERKVLQNTKCKLDAELSSAWGHATRLQLTLHFSFLSGFGGAKSLLVYSQDRAGIVAGWQLRGGWMVPALAGNVQPAVSYFAPNSGTFPANAFVMQISDLNGASDITDVHFLVNSSLSYPNSCYVKYTRSLNRLQLLNDNTTAFLGALTPGASGTVENSKCILSGAYSAASESGNVLTLVVYLAFKSPAAGSNNMWTLVSDQSNVFLGWQSQGTITVPLSPSFTRPEALSVSVTPLSSSTARFLVTGFDENGSQDIRDLYLLVNTSVSYANGCFLLYRSPTQQVFLLNDAGSSWQAIGTLPGGETLENSQCRVSLALASESSTQDTKTIAYEIYFKPSFTGTRSSYAYVEDEAKLISGWKFLGTLSLPFP